MTNPQHYLDNLNQPQHDAVCAPLTNLMVLAGAGSGKTRVLVSRIAHLIEHHHVSPHQIFAVTFTNKAAGEMRHRLEALLGLPMTSMWVGTFHGLAHRFLRQHWEQAKLPQTFHILDSDDQLQLIKRVLKNATINEDEWPPKKIQWFINHHKNEGNRASSIDPDFNPYGNDLLTIYQMYEELCQQSGCVDFPELLLRAHETLRDNPSLLASFHERFTHILVDEFQDTNTIQYAWLRLLAGKNQTFTIVGDDDQSIYGWRGAKIENIHRFEHDFSDVITVRLEQNYRSTSTILNAANALIANNNDRFSKELWTEGNTGEPIGLYAAFNEIDEARFIASQIKQWSESGNSRQDCAILYRSNAQSRVLEEALIQNNIPYRIYGGKRFFERAEIKDALGYMRLIQNRHDDAAIERVINTPTRGIGDKTISLIRDKAKESHSSLWQAAITIIDNKELPARAHTAVLGFLRLIDEIEEHTKELQLGELCEHVLTASNLLDFYKKSKSDLAQSKLDNLEELINATKLFEPNPEEDLPDLVAFLSHASLEAGEAQGDMSEDCVQMMTLHSAKGLEFPFVILAGLEEGLFPHSMSFDDPTRLQEERRLCYVGMTRAMERLLITYAETRRTRGQTHYNRASRFVTEIPKEWLQEVRLQATLRKPVSSYATNSRGNSNYTVPESAYQVGGRVMHPKFGEGVILNFEGRGRSARLQVKFNHAGTKWLVAQHAKLEKI